MLISTSTQIILLIREDATFKFARQVFLANFYVACLWLFLLSHAFSFAAYGIFTAPWTHVKFVRERAEMQLVSDRPFVAHFVIMISCNGHSCQSRQSLN